MPYDSVYSEKRPPGTLRTARRKFYSDASAMVSLYGCAGLAVLLFFGSWFAPYTASTSNFSVINYCRRRQIAAYVKFLSSRGLTTSDAMF